MQSRTVGIVNETEDEKESDTVSTQPFDAARYKAGQRREWDSASTGWKNWWQQIEQALRPVSDRMMDLAEIRAGQQVLDIATGIGEPAVTAAQRIGPSGHVIAIDFSSQMLDVGRERAVDLGLHNIDFREMDAETLDLPENSFDLIFCRLGLMYLPDPQAALAKMWRLLVPDGRLVAAVWGPPQKVPFASVPMGVLLRELQLQPPPPGTPGVFSLADTHRVEQLLMQAGFTQVHTEPLTVIMDWSSPEEFVRFQQEALTQINAILGKYPAERQAEVWQAIKEALRQYGTKDGGCHLENELIVLAGRR